MHVDDMSTFVDINSKICRRKLQLICRRYLQKLVAETVCRCNIQYPVTCLNKTTKSSIGANVVSHTIKPTDRQQV